MGWGARRAQGDQDGGRVSAGGRDVPAKLPPGPRAAPGPGRVPPALPAPTSVPLTSTPSHGAAPGGRWQGPLCSCRLQPPAGNTRNATARVQPLLLGISLRPLAADGAPCPCDHCREQSPPPTRQTPLLPVGSKDSAGTIPWEGPEVTSHQHHPLRDQVTRPPEATQEGPAEQGRAASRPADRAGPHRDSRWLPGGRRDPLCPGTVDSGPGCFLAEAGSSPLLTRGWGGSGGLL